MQAEPSVPSNSSAVFLASLFTSTSTPNTSLPVSSHDHTITPSTSPTQQLNSLPSIETDVYCDDDDYQPDEDTMDDETSGHESRRKGYHHFDAEELGPRYVRPGSRVRVVAPPHASGRGKMKDFNFNLQLGRISRAGSSMYGGWYSIVLDNGREVRLRRSSFKTVADDAKPPTTEQIRDANRAGGYCVRSTFEHPDPKYIRRRKDSSARKEKEKESSTKSTAEKKGKNSSSNNSKHDDKKKPKAKKATAKTSQSKSTSNNMSFDFQLPTLPLFIPSLSSSPLLSPSSLPSSPLYSFPYGLPPLSFPLLPPPLFDINSSSTSAGTTANASGTCATSLSSSFSLSSNFSDTRAPSSPEMKILQPSNLNSKASTRTAAFKSNGLKHRGVPSTLVTNSSSTPPQHFRTVSSNNANSSHTPPTRTDIDADANNNTMISCSPSSSSTIIQVIMQTSRMHEKKKESDRDANCKSSNEEEEQQQQQQQQQDTCWEDELNDFVQSPTEKKCHSFDSYASQNLQLFQKDLEESEKKVEDEEDIDSDEDTKKSETESDDDQEELLAAAIEQEVQSRVERELQQSPVDFPSFPSSLFNSPKIFQARTYHAPSPIRTRIHETPTSLLRPSLPTFSTAIDVTTPNRSRIVPFKFRPRDDSSTNNVASAAPIKHEEPVSNRTRASTSSSKTSHKRRAASTTSKSISSGSDTSPSSGESERPKKKERT